MKLGLIGGGLIWDNVHRSIVNDMSPEVVVTAYCCRSPETKNKLAKQLPQAQWFATYQQLLDSADIDAAVVLTPIELNAPVAMAALKAGRHVLLEKPVVTSMEEGRKLRAAQQASDKDIYILEQFVYDPAMTAMGSLIAAGQIGTPISFEMTFFHALFPEDDQDGGYGKTVWRQQPQFPLGLMFDAGVHGLAVLSTLFGAPQRAYALGRQLRPEYGPYDFVTTLLEYESGVCGNFIHSGQLGANQDYFIVRGTNGLLHYAEGALTFEPREVHPGIDLLHNSSTTQLQLPAKSDYRCMWEALIDYIGSGQTPQFDLSQALRDIAMMLAIEQSLSSGAPAPVPSIDQ